MTTPYFVGSLILADVQLMCIIQQRVISHQSSSLVVIEGVPSRSDHPGVNSQRSTTPCSSEDTRTAPDRHTTWLAFKKRTLLSCSFAHTPSVGRSPETHGEDGLHPNGRAPCTRWTANIRTSDTGLSKSRMSVCFKSPSSNKI